MGPAHGTTSNLLVRGGGRVLLEPLPEQACVAAEEGARPADVGGEEEHPRAAAGGTLGPTPLPEEPYATAPPLEGPNIAALLSERSGSKRRRIRCRAPRPSGF